MVTKKKFVDPGLNDPNRQQSIPPEFGGVKTNLPTSPITTKDTSVNPDEPASLLENTTMTGERGRPFGITKGGRTFFIQGSDLSLFQQQQAEKEALSGGATQGAIPLREALAQRADMQARQELLSQLGPQAGLLPGVDLLTAPLISKTTVAQAFAAGGIAAGTTAAATAITGPVALGAAAAVGVTTTVGTFISKITVEQRQNVKEANIIFSQSQQNMVAIINRLNGDPNYSPEQSLRDWNSELYNIEVAGINLRKLTEEPTRKVLSGGGEEMIRYNLWKSGEFPSLQAKFINAFANPNPNSPFLTYIPETE